MISQLSFRPLFIKETFAFEVAVELLGKFHFDVGEQVFEEVVHNWYVCRIN